jgi:hypothetical protein
MKDSWLGATQDGPGSAAHHPSGWRPDRILNRKVINLLGTAAGSAGVVLIALSVFLGSPSAAEPEPSWDEMVIDQQSRAAPTDPVASITPPAVSPTPVLSTPVAQTSTPMRTYAIALPELRGLPPNAAPGTQLDVWVTLDPPLTKGPRIQKLLKGVLLQEIAPPAVEGAPPVALLSVTTKHVVDLLWGDRYGDLSVVLLPGA